MVNNNVCHTKIGIKSDNKRNICTYIALHVKARSDVKISIRVYIYHTRMTTCEHYWHASYNQDINFIQGR